LGNVDEVLMTKAQANDVKGMITGDTLMLKKKGLDKITLRNHMDFVFTSNNDFCVIIDTYDRRYFILDLILLLLYFLPSSQLLAIGTHTTCIMSAIKERKLKFFSYVKAIINARLDSFVFFCFASLVESVVLSC